MLLKWFSTTEYNCIEEYTILRNDIFNICYFFVIRFIFIQKFRIAAIDTIEWATSSKYY
jgi:hypothetical protein